MLRYTQSPTPAPLTGLTADGYQIHQAASDLPHLPVGRFARHPQDSRIFVLACGFPAKESGRVHVSEDGGHTWQPCAPFCTDGSITATDSGAFIVTHEGTLIAAFGNSTERANWNWDNETHDSPGAELPTCTMRSLDGGKTWQDLQCLHRDWTGANRDMIQTRSGRLVFTSMKMLHNPGRHAVLCYTSDDDGKTWTASNLLDFGGVGHHGGLTEATLIELNDSRLMKFIRTNWEQFWRAYSVDDGSHWHSHGPAGIDASSAPGFLQRLADGRLVLVWNRPLPEGKDTYERRGGDCNWSATPVSNFRHELSIAFSDDEGESWTSPVVIARNPQGEISYPYAFEFQPNRLWITAGRGRLHMSLDITRLS